MSDLISRQAAIEEITRERNCTERLDDYTGLDIAIAILESEDELPTIDPVRHGKWIAVEYGDGTVRTECSACGYGRGLPPVRNYCPNCGAKMDGGEIHDHYNCTGCGFMSTCTDEEAQQCLKPHISQ